MAAGNFFGGQFFGGGFFGALQTETVTTNAGTGGRSLRRRRPELWSVTVEGKPYVFDSLDSLIAFLDSRESKVVEQAEKKAERDALRIVRVGRANVTSAPPQIQLKSENADIRDYAADLQAKVDRIYWKALSSELARAAEEDEDVLFIARVLND